MPLTPLQFDDKALRCSTTQLLLLTARHKLDPTSSASVRKLAASDIDWNRFTDLAASKFSLPYALRHLRSTALELVPNDVMQRMSGLSQNFGLATLKIAAAQIEFHKKCIAPLNAQHVYLKGVALSAQTGGQITDRFCRDVDVLIAKKDMKRVVERAIAHNYKMVVDTEPFEVVESPSDQRFFARYAEVVTLISPDNVTIEVHRKLTKLSLKFDNRKIFSTSDRISISGIEMQTLSPSLHFVYTCYHHSRHFWSRLHWLTDIDGFLRDHNFSKQEVLEIADEIGIAPTVNATCEFHDLLAQPERWNEPELIDSHGGQYLVACLTNLRGGLEVEKELRQNMTLGDFMSSWQVSSSRYNEMWINSWFHRLKPSITQHLARRYPPYFQWVYYIENVLSLAKNAFNLARPGKRKATQHTTAK